MDRGQNGMITEGSVCKSLYRALSFVRVKFGMRKNTGVAG